MIVTVTMNPAVDKTVNVGTIIPGGLNRISRVEYDAGGKGINVSKTICELGGESIATGFLAGNTGAMIEGVLRAKGITCDFIHIEGETRTNTKVIEESGEVTELNEPGAIPTKGQLEELLCKLETYASEDVLFVLAGSVPGGVEKSIYGDIIRLVHKKQAKVLLDADGELFRLALDTGPEIIKPNRVELEEYKSFGHHVSKEELLMFAKELREQGIETVAVSMGQEGAILVKGNYEVVSPALAVKTYSTVGAGDAMVAALSYAWEKDFSEEETMKLCMATSAGAVMTNGTKPPTKKQVEDLISQVVIEKMSI